MKAKWLVCLAVLMVSGAAAYGVIPTFRGLGDLPGGLFCSRGLGVSGDGMTAVGWGTPGNRRAFRWTAGEGMVALGGNLYHASDASADGAVVAGTGWFGTGSGEAFRWTEDGGGVGLGDLPGGSYDSAAWSVSGDGLVVVGHSEAAEGLEAFRWTSAGMVGLGDLTGGDFYSVALGVSGDGSVVVGHSESTPGRQAFRWTQATGMVGMDDLPGGDFYSGANAVSADGSVVVGYSTSDQSGSNTEAFRWTADTEMVGLGFLPGEGYWTEAVDVSADGTVIIGHSYASGSKSFIWDAAGGMRNLEDVLVDECGLNLTGWILGYAEGLSDDGRTIVGYGINPDGNYEAWMAVIPEPASATVLCLGALAIFRRRKW